MECLDYLHDAVQNIPKARNLCARLKTKLVQDPLSLDSEGNPLEEKTVLRWVSSGLNTINRKTLECNMVCVNCYIRRVVQEVLEVSWTFAYHIKKTLRSTLSVSSQGFINIRSTQLRKSHKPYTRLTFHLVQSTLGTSPETGQSCITHTQEDA